MIEMSVREQDGLGPEAFLREQVFEGGDFSGAVAAGVGDDAAAGLLPGHVEAFLEEIAGEGSDIQHVFAHKDWQIYKRSVNFV